MRTDPDEDRHRTFETLAVAHVMGGLSEPEGRIFRSHLLECAQCRARVGELRALDHELADVERAERRVKAAQAIETKTPEVEEETAPERPEQPSRVPRLAVVAGLVLLIVLVGWNYVVRGTVQEQAGAIMTLREATQLLIEGRSAPIHSPTGQFGQPSQVRYDTDDVLVVLDDVAPGTTLYAYQLDADDNVVGSREALTGEALTGEDDRLVRLLDRAEGAVALYITDPSEGARPSTRVEGTIVLDATLDAAARRSAGG